MKSLGARLRQLRGEIPRREMAERLGISYGYLANLERGLRIPDERRARRLLQKGYHLAPRQIDRLLLDVHLLDAGLTDDELRALVLDLVYGPASADLREACRRLYRVAARQKTRKRTTGP